MELLAKLAPWLLAFITIIGAIASIYSGCVSWRESNKAQKAAASCRIIADQVQSVVGSKSVTQTKTGNSPPMVVNLNNCDGVQISQSHSLASIDKKESKGI
jgi:hypothetical protein